MDQVTFGPYRILGLLGRGGMAEVHRAYDSRTDRVVALKLLPAEVSADEEYAARFRRECRSAARLSEAHVVPIHGFGEIDGRLYLDMRLVEGTDVATWLRMHGPMSPDVAVAVIGQVAQALDAAHAAGLVHRDVTPSNVVLAGVADRAVDASTVFAYLLDFGIARPRAGAVGPDAALLTRAGVLPGSPSYVA
ncbi:MAG: serine/threonine kinase PknH, partial [Pseudonocardiales bacterium]|nr:serine/threonine kinase PknH [Pseudonocardiales bacterium]